MSPLLLLLLCCFSLSTITATSDKATCYIEGYDLADPVPELLLPLSKDNKDITLELEVVPTISNHLVKLNVGEVLTNATIDTGSDLIWLNGEDCACDQCFCKKQTARKVKKPSTSIKCEDPTEELCHIAQKISNHEPLPTCAEHPSGCRYSVEFPDHCTTKGDFTKGQFGFHNNDQKYPIQFGMSDYTTDPLDKESDGVVGLGRGKLSLISQLRKQNFDHKFSYCLHHPYSNRRAGPVNKLRIGKDVDLSKKEKHIINLVDPTGTDCGCHHCVMLNSYSVYGEKTKDTNHPIEPHHLIIDSGATFSKFKPEIFDEISKAVRLELTGVDGNPLSRSSAKKICGYQKCYKVTEECKEVKNMKAKLGFDGESSIELNYYNFLDCIQQGEEYYACLTVKKVKSPDPKQSKEETMVLGSRAQIGFNVVFDLSTKYDEKVSFDRDTCSDPLNDSIQSRECKCYIR